MCYRVREPERRLDHVTQVPLPPGEKSFVRPRLVGAVAAALVAVVATAAMLMPSSTPAVSSEQAVGATTVSRLDAPVTQGPVIEQTASMLDDDVPSSSSDVASAKTAGHCDHGL